MFRAFEVPPPARLDPACVSCTPPERDPETVAFTDHWKVVLHPSQCGPGNVLLVSRRHVARMADLTDDEARGFHAVVRALEPALERAFGAPLVNMHYQRNWAHRERAPDPPFRDGRPNPHVHWHVLPRYPRPVAFGGLTFEDPAFGEEYVWRDVHVPASVRSAILRRVRERLDVVVVPAP